MPTRSTISSARNFLTWSTRNEVRRHPPGMKAVLVNGATVVEDGQCIDVFPGKVRRQQLCMPN